MLLAVNIRFGWQPRWPALLLTAFAGLFNLHVQRQGLMISDRAEFLGDPKRLPAVRFKRS